MNTYTAGKGGGALEELGDSREWVFPLLATPRYRKRVDQLGGLDLRRRVGCEPCLRALVTGKWTDLAFHHLGWCDSCRAAGVALGLNAGSDPSFVRRHAGWMAVAAFAAVAVPLVASQVVNQGSQVGVRGGVAISTTAPGATKPGTTLPGTGTRAPRSRHSSALALRRGGGATKVLPLTT